MPEKEKPKPGDELQTSAPRVLFGLLTAITGFLIYSALIPPHVPRVYAYGKGSVVRDTVMVPYQDRILGVSRSLFLAIAVYQALHIGFSPSMREGAAQKGVVAKYPLNKTLLTFNLVSIPALLLISGAALLRTYAFSQLGRNFTFALQAPSHLKTDGLYAWVQHPSYVAGWAAFSGAALWFGRLDGAALGLVAPEWLRARERGVHRVMAIVVPVALAILLGIRIRDEEAMLRQQFGAEWQAWHEKTARLVPGVF